jgi:hypothetical protein
LAAGLSLAGLAFATWLEDGDIPARVIDALMVHQQGRLRRRHFDGGHGRPGRRAAGAP